MPLIALDRIKTWYQPDSLVFRSFQYLFINPLYVKRVPGGASVCAFFWAAMFSLFVFQPFIVPFLRLLRWGAYKAGLVSLIQLCDRHAHRAHKALKRDDDLVSSPTLGMDSLKLLGRLFQLGFMMIVPFMGVTYISYTVCRDGEVLSLFWAGALLVWGHILFIITGCSLDWSDRTGRWGSWLISGAALTLAITTHPDLFTGVFVSLAHGIAFIISYLSSSIWGALLAYWRFYLGCVVVTVVGLYSAYRFEYLPSLQESYLWYQLKPARRVVRGWIISRMAEALHEREVQEVGWGYCLTPRGWREYMDTSYALTDAVYEIVDSTAWLKVTSETLHIRISIERLDDVAGKVYLERKGRVAAKAAAEAKAEARRKRLEESAVARFLDQIKTAVFGRLNRAAAFVATFACLLWELAKARKQGVCPWIRFEEAPDQDA